ncbi:MAG TPA: hypothetical protein VLX92_15540 [Kofleriaceae bacterium]|nr:hypothetical protein [Kofleriaceae bacterium]
MRGRLAVLGCALIAAPTSAVAGRSNFGWLYGTEVLPERGAEIATWLQETNDLDQEDHLSETRWWIAPMIGITDQLELALPVELAWDRSDVVSGHSAFDRFGGELRYRFVSSDPVDAPPLVPLLRVAVERAVLERATTIPQADLVTSYDVGIVQMLVDLGMYAELSSATQHFEFHPGAGVSVKAIGDLRFGAEVHAEITLDSGSSWAAIGPNVAWAHGRSWLSAAYGIGIYHIRDAPRLQWGIAF